MKFKGKSFIAIVLTPENPADAWFAEIDRIIARSPGFFIDRPIILDLRGSKMAIDDLEGLLEGLEARSIKVMGIDGIAGKRLKPGMPPSFSGGRLTADVELPDPSASQAAKSDSDSSAAADAADAKSDASDKAASKKASKGSGKDAGEKSEVLVEGQGDRSSIVINEPVRSGQSVMHPAGDVTIVGSVSSGAEVIAGGSIHVYGALRGRALAGVSGDETARIFCSKLDAELVSINGLYTIADDFSGDVANQPAQIRFEDEKLIFEAL